MQDLPLWMTGTTPELIEKAKRELKETPETQANALLELRKLINGKPDFYCLEDDKFLIRFLRVKKYDAERAFKILQNYYNFKVTFPGILTERMRLVFDLGNICISPKRARDGGSIMTLFSGRLNLDECTPEEYFQAMSMCAETMIEMDVSQICGAHIIIDLSGITLKKLRCFSKPAFLSLLIKGIEDCLPYRMSSLHVMNAPFYCHLPCTAIWHMLNKKNQERIHFHGSNLTELHKLFPLDTLPKELGGVLDHDTFADVRKTLMSKQLDIERINKYSFHRLHKKPVKKHSTCGLEENSSFLQGNASTNFGETKVVI